MPASPSPSRNTRLPPPRRRFLAPLLVIVCLAIVVVVIVALPASLARRILPDSLHADDFSGSIWHGSTGRISVDAHDAGALEWRLHPLALLGLNVTADLHWVLGGFAADAVVEVNRQRFNAQNIRGGGPIEDLAPLGIAAGWRGQTNFNFSDIRLKFSDGRVTPLAVVGELEVAALASAQIAGGAELGAYRLQAADGAITPDTDATAELRDTGGPLELQAVIHYSAAERTGTLSGTVKERTGMPAALQSQIEQLAQIHARDAQGRIPVDLEFTL